MAIALVGSQFAKTADNGVTAAFPGNITSGNLIIAVGGVYNSAGTPVTGDFTDTRGTTLTVSQFGPNPSAQRYFIAYGIATGSGANTVTFSTHTGAARNFAVAEFSGVSATPLDATGTLATGTSTSPACSLTTVAANALVIGVMSHVSGASSLTPSGSWNQIDEQESVVNDPFSAVYQIVTTATSYSPTWTTGASVNWGAVAWSFAPATGGAVVIRTLAALGVG